MRWCTPHCLNPVLHHLLEAKELCPTTIAFVAFLSFAPQPEGELSVCTEDAPGGLIEVMEPCGRTCDSLMGRNFRENN